VRRSNPVTAAVADGAERSADRVPGAPRRARLSAGQEFESYVMTLCK